MDALGWPLPTCSYCNYSLVRFSSLIQKSHHQECISHGQGVKATQVCCGPKKTSSSTKGAASGNLSLLLPGGGCVAWDVEGKGRKGWAEGTRTAICRESWRYLIMGLVCQPSTYGAGRQFQLQCCLQ